MSHPVPVHDYISTPRFDNLAALFYDRYKCKPEYFVRAPGRVNLIGEHIDYCGYGVCPMALEQSVLMAVSTSEMPQINICNINTELYPDLITEASQLKIDLSSPSWANYVKCGLIGMTRHLGLECLTKGFNVGYQKSTRNYFITIFGLSSSSALVCAAAVVVYHVVGTEEISANQLAELCGQFEWLIGTQGGGMDQAASFLSIGGSACSIEFNPLRMSLVTLPKGMSFVVANCGVELNKSATSHFNTRVNECRLAAMVISKSMGVDWRNVRKLGTLQLTLGLTLEDMVNIVNNKLHKEIYSRAEIAVILDIPEDELINDILASNVAHVNEFDLYSRAFHVYTEALRVSLFVSVSQNQTPDESEDMSVAYKLGNLMDLSHHSCSVMYDCSCPLLDNLVQCCRDAGALGSRLTGAGWGGCCVSLVPTPLADQFIKQVLDSYYRPNNISSDIFLTLPSTGVFIVTA